MRRFVLIPMLCCVALSAAETKPPAPAPATTPAPAPAPATKPGPAPTTTPPAGPVIPEDQLVKDAGYVLGLEVAQKVGGTIQQFTLNIDDVMQGIRDGSTNTKPRISTDQAKVVMQQFMDRHKAKAAEQAKLDALEAPKRKEANAAWLGANAKKPGIITTKSGLQYEVLKASDKGASPKLGDAVVCSYSGKLINDKVFDASDLHGGPATFTIGQVIPGWNEALPMMKEGDKWRLFIPSELAYGANGPPDIGADAVLIFEVELHQVKGPAGPPMPNQAP